MMITTRPRRTRDVPGPQPNSFGLIARNPGKVPVDQIIRERQLQEDMRRLADEADKLRRTNDIRSTWERETNQKIVSNAIKRRVQGALRSNEMMLEARRDRLRTLLQSEEEQFEKEFEAMKETLIERQAKMREKAKQLKERKEESRMEFVMEKYEQQWKNQCEELRSTMSKRLQDEIAVERLEQMRLKDEEKLRSKEEDDMYAKMWYADMEAKARREEEDVRRQMSANKETLEVLLQQMAALEGQKALEKKLVEEEAQLLKEQAELRKLEERQAQEEKRRKQLETRAMYDQNIAKKRQIEARRVQEELAFDMQILESLLEETKNEALAQQQRKRELRDEDRRYRDYLKMLKEEEAIREKEMDRLCNEEVEKSWQKRLAQWRLEKEARKKLLQEVIDYRNKQLNEKLAQNELRREEAKRDREELLRKIEENRQLDAAERQRLSDQNRLHQSDLRGQIAYNSRLRENRQQEKLREWESQSAAEAEYQRKLKLALENPQIEKLHPMRRAHLQQHPMSSIL